MSILKVAAALGLAAALVARQQPTPGNPDDVAELLPERTPFFAELVRAPLILKEWKDYAGAWCTPAGKANVVKEIEKAVSQALDIVPEKLLKDLEKGLPSLQRLAVALTEMNLGGQIGWLVVATSSDAEFFKRIVEEDLKVFAGDEKLYQGVKVLEIRKLGEIKFPSPLLIASAGRRLLLSTNRRSLEAALDRAAGKGSGPDLRQNAMYQKFSKPSGEEPLLRAFASISWSELTDGPSFGGYSWRRSSAHGLDEADASLGIRKIRGATVESVFRPGKIATTTRISVDEPCPLYDALRQPAGAKETLRFVPSDAQVVAHVNVKGGKAVWTDVQALLKRASEVAKKANPNRPPQSLEDMFTKEMAREVGFGPADLAAALGNEAAFAMLSDNIFAGGGQAALESLLFVVKLADPAKAKEIVEKLAAKLGAYEKKTEGTATLYIPEKEVHDPVFALDGSIGMIGAKADVLRKALKASGADNIAKQLAPGAAESSKLIMVRNSAVWSLFAMALGPRLPDLSKDLALDAWTTIVFSESKTELKLSSVDAGVGLNTQVGVVAAPFMLMFAFTARGFDEEAPAASKPAEPFKEPPALPADKLAEAVKKHLPGLRSEDVGARDDAERALKQLGRQAVPLLVEAARKESDAEVKGRLMGILAAWKAYDAVPELLKGKVEGFLREFHKFAADENRGGFVRWDRQEGAYSFPYNMEPGYVNLGLLNRLEHRDLLDSPVGIRALAEKLRSPGFSPAQSRLLAALFAYVDSSAATDLVLEAIKQASDAQTKCFLQIALGWSSDAKAREALLAGLKEKDVWMRRATFIGLERTKDGAAVPKLLDLLTDADPETRWNASFVLRELGGDPLTVNVLLPDDELKPALAAARQWWSKNQATFKP